MKAEFKVGDIITTYHKGWWQVIEVFDLKYNLGSKEGVTPQLKYKNLFNSRIDSCARAFCRHVTMESVQEMIKKDVEKYDKIIQYLEKHTNKG